MYVVRGPVSAGLRTRTPGVGENKRAVAAGAVARRRSIMVLGRAARSLVGSRRPACCPFSRDRGAAPGPAARRAWSSVDGVLGEMAARFHIRSSASGRACGPLLFRQRRNSSALVATGAALRGGLAGVYRRETATRPRAASRPLRDRCRRTGDVHAMRGTRSAQLQLIHKAPTTAAAATAPLTRSPPAPAATPPRRCSVGTD